MINFYDDTEFHLSVVIVGDLQLFYEYMSPFTPPAHYAKER